MLTTRSARFQRWAKKRRERKKKTTSGARGIHLLDLPNEIFYIVFESLDLSDCMVLALTCKDLALKLDHNGLLDWEKTRLLRSEIAHFTKKRLSEGFFPRELRYCWKCGK
jgi:F-box domain